MAIMLITHDLGVVAETCDAVIVMYAGQVVEEGPVDDALPRPAAPVHRGAAALHPAAGQQAERLAVIPGVVPCRSTGRRVPLPCALPLRLELCQREEPPLFELGPGRRNKCWLGTRAARGGAARGRRLHRDRRREWQPGRDGG